jgi:hypothetical protein
VDNDDGVRSQYLPIEEVVPAKHWVVFMAETTG